MKEKLLLFTILFFSTNILANEGILTINEIPDSLKESAYSIVQLDNTFVDVKSQDEMKIYRKRVISVIDNNGRDHVKLSIHLDPTMSLKKFKGRIYSSDGELIKELSKKDLVKSEFSQYLHTDDYVYMYSPNKTISVPFTISYEWEEVTTKNILTYPMFIPIKYHNQSLINSEYKLIAPQKYELKYLPNLCDAKLTMLDSVKYEAKIEKKHFKAIDFRYGQEPMSYMLPIARFQPETFSSTGYDGETSSWKTIGIWLSLLKENRDELTAEQIEMYKAMTDTCSSDLSKVMVLYKHLRNATRYVNISLGIGGLQPEKAKDVAIRGYGDCKGLSNYMHSILKAVGVESIYAVIKNGDKSFYSAYPSIGQFNHAILYVPLHQNPLWIECTAPSLPLGYVHSGIAGNYALLVDGENSRLMQLPHITDSLDYKKSYCRIELLNNGKAMIDTKEIYSGSYYEKCSKYENISSKDFRDEICKKLKLPNAHLIEFECNSNITQPITQVNFSLSVPKLGQFLGKRIILPEHIIESPLDFDEKITGDYNLVLEHQKKMFEVDIILPEGYIIPNENIKEFQLDENFGKFIFKMISENNQIKITSEFELYRGLYSKEERICFEKFTNSIKKYFSEKIVIVSQ